MLRRISFRFVEDVTVKKQTLSRFQRHGDSSGFVNVQLDSATVCFILDGMLVIRLALFVAAGDQPEATVFHVGVIQGCQA